MWKVGTLQSIDIPGTNEGGWGFNITTEHGRPLVTFSYKTKADGSAAAAQIQSAIQKAVLVKPHS